MSGAIVLPDFDSSAVDIVRRASRLADGASRVFYAPFVARRRRRRRGAAAPAACGGGPGPGRHRSRSRSSGSGRGRPRKSTITTSSGPRSEMRLAQAGVVGEVAGVFFDRQGRVCRPAVTARLITISEAGLRGIREVIAVVSGAAKREAVRAACRGTSCRASSRTPSSRKPCWQSPERRPAALSGERGSERGLVRLRLGFAHGSSAVSPRHRPGRRAGKPHGRPHPRARQARPAVRRGVPARRLRALQPEPQRDRGRVALGAVPSGFARPPRLRRSALGPRPHAGRLPQGGSEQGAGSSVESGFSQGNADDLLRMRDEIERSGAEVVLVCEC